MKVTTRHAFALFLAFALVLSVLWLWDVSSTGEATAEAYSQLLEDLDAGRVGEVIVSGDTVEWIVDSERRHSMVPPDGVVEAPTEVARRANVPVREKPAIDLDDRLRAGISVTAVLALFIGMPVVALVQVWAYRQRPEQPKGVRQGMLWSMLIVLLPVVGAGAYFVSRNDRLTRSAVVVLAAAVLLAGLAGTAIAIKLLATKSLIDAVPAARH